MDNWLSSGTESLKKVLTEMPILAHTDFSHAAHQFKLHTDGSASGLGAVLEQNSRVIAYAIAGLWLLKRETTV